MRYHGFHNHTRHVAEPFLLADEDGAALLAVVAKRTFDIVPLPGAAGRDNCGLEVAREQSSVHRTAVHRGEPGASSLEHESEAVFAKAAADVVLKGHAQPERGRAAELDVVLAVGPLRKQVRVFGDRVWRRSASGFTISAPEPFERLPLVYERAFGGADPRNPVGTGFVPEGEAAREPARLPNLEDPRRLIARPHDRPSPVGFGFVAPGWEPRRSLAGTYDDAWREARFPRLPVDFDRRHLNAAPADQQVSGFLHGGEPVEVVNASPRGPLRFTVPRAPLDAVIRLRGGVRRLERLVLDTLVIDTDRHVVHAVQRASFDVHRAIHDVESIELHEGLEGERGDGLS